MSLSLPIVAGVALAVLVGVSLGLLGGGGSILTVPILVYVMRVPPHEAIALSLLVVGSTSLAALVPHARARNVRWKTGVLFGTASMLGAFAAGKLARFVPAVALLIAFGAVMLASAVAMMRGRAAPEAGDDGREKRLAELPIAKIALEGLGVGAVTGFVGAGGGFLVVPVLVLLGRLPMRAAVGTSLLVIAMNSCAGVAGFAGSVRIDWTIAAAVTGAAVLGSVGGSALAGRVPQPLLRRGFAWFVVAMAVFVLSREIPGALGLDPARVLSLSLGATGLPLLAGAIDLARRARSAPPDPRAVRRA